MLKTITLRNANALEAGGIIYPAVIGKGGLIAATDKREGDGCTPRGRYPLRMCYYHPNFIPLPPRTGLHLIPLSWTDGWCDDSAHPEYNHPVQLPFPASHEKLWRTDHVYDLIIPIGYNDSPPIPGLGSAIFLHAMHDSGRATEGCIALKKHDLLDVLAQVDAQTVIEIL